MAAAHWLCAVESGTHAQAVAVGVGGTAWSHFAVSAEPLVTSVEKFVSQPTQPVEKLVEELKKAYMSLTAQRSALGG